VARDRFRFDTGSLALDLVATVGWRFGDRVEWLAEPVHFALWLQQAGLVDSPAQVGEGAHEAGLDLREAIHGAARAASEGEVPAAGDRELINRLAALPLRVPGLDQRGRLGWSATDPVTAALGTIARDAAVLIGGPDAAAIRSCEEPRCRMLFLDRSRGRRRRWCSMAECGNRAKVAAHRERARAADWPLRSGPKRSEPAGGPG
jgi:predicted RNA-binding Zn ribbon-like protein